MKKFLNKRPILFFAVIMLIALITIIYYDNFILKIVLACVFGAFAIVGLILFICFKRSVCKLIFSRMLLWGVHQ